MRKSDVKAMLMVTAGVMVAGILMYQFRDVGIVAQARDGYGA